MSVAASAATFPDPFAEIQLLTLHSLRGANYWSRRPVTRMDVALGAYEDLSSADVPWFTDALVAALPGLVEHRCSIGRRGGFIQRMREGTYAAHIAEHVALELQTMIGHDAGYGRTRGTGTVGEYTVVLEHLHDGVGLRAAALGLETVQHAFAGDLASVEPVIAELRSIAATPDAPPLTAHIRCGIVGSASRAATRDALIARVGEDETQPIVDVSFGYLLQAGLPYAKSDVAIVLDAAPTDVPHRYQDDERAARLAVIVADAVPRGGAVVCPAELHLVHDLVRDAGRRVVKFTPHDDPAEHATRAADAAARVLGATS